MGRAPLRDARCAEKRAAWERFKEYCAHSNWQEFRCEQFVRLMNGCVDATKIRPCPDGDLTCPVRSSEADRRPTIPVSANFGQCCMLNCLIDLGLRGNPSNQPPVCPRTDIPFSRPAD
jgi:hypothetical protein